MAARAGLTSRQRSVLLDQGYLVMCSQLDKAVLARVRDRLDALVRQTVAASADDPSLDTTEACVVAEFSTADPGFAPCHQYRLIADAAALVLGDRWHVRGLDLRAPIPGAGEQGLHQDYAERGPGWPWQTLSAMWCITPFTPDSGPLRILPGSHRLAGPPIDDRDGPDPDEVKIIAAAGSLILFNAADLWHSGTFNYTPARLALTVHADPGEPATAQADASRGIPAADAG